MATIVGMLAAALLRQGAFYPATSFGLALVATAVLIRCLVSNRDRAARTVAVAVGVLAGWWLARALSAHTPSAFLPLGASMLAFLAAFLAVRLLVQGDRERVAIAIVALSTILAISGVAGVLARSSSLATLTGTVWRASSTLTDPEATALVCGIGAILALTLELRRPLVRVALCFCVTGLLATQSHWLLLAVGLAVPFIPVRRWPAAIWPLATGVTAGLAVIASSSGSRQGWLAVGVAGLAVIGSALPVPMPIARPVVAAAVVLLLAAGTVVLALHLPMTGSPRIPLAQNQTLSWTSSFDTWRTSVITGVGPSRVHTTSGPVGTYPGFVPDTYLTTAADGGLIALLLLLGAGAAVAGSIRRRDVLSSCAAGAVVTFAVAGSLSFAWELPAVALIGGCLAGLATDLPTVVGASVGDGEVTPAQRRVPTWTIGVWSLAAVTVIGVQMIVGDTHQAAGATPVVRSEPPASSDPAAPGRIVLTGPDPTDPFLVQVGTRDLLYTSEGTSFLNVPLWIGTGEGHWARPVDVLPKLPGWAEGGLTWAPDVHRVAGGWALYFSALVKGIDPPTHCIGSAFATSPLGPFVPTQRPFICQLDHRGSIDARVFDAPGNRLIMLWKSEDNANPGVPGPDQNGPTGIYAQLLSANGRTLLGQPTKILGPTEPWEGTIVEAPDMIEAWGTYWLFFSGNWYDTPEYGIGVAACQSPMGPCTDPSPVPFLGSNEQGSGPGEESLFVGERGVYLLYNPFHANDPGPVIPRPVAMTPLGFAARGPYVAAW